MKFLKRCKNEMSSLYVDCSTELAVNRGKYKRTASLALFFATLINMMVMVFAGAAPTATTSPDDIAKLGDTIVSTIVKIYNAAFLVLTVLAALLLIIAFIVRMTSNQQKAAQATQWIIRILICYVAVNCIGLIFKVIQSTTEGMGFGDKFGNQYPDIGAGN